MTPPPSDAAAVTRRFLVLVALRWLPTGLLVPVLVLVLLERGLSLAQIGLVFMAQGVMVMLLELPTGGLADVVGRRRVLLAAGIFEVVALALFTVADSLPAFIVAFALQGIYRALESGPLEAWYVDLGQSIDAEVDIERGLSGAGIAVGLGIGVGALLASGLVALDPVPSIDPLVVPVLASLLLRIVDLLAIAALMTEDPIHASTAGLRGSLSEVPGVVASAVAMVRRSRVLAALVAVEFLWGFGMTSFETFTPVKLASVVDSSDLAAAMLGPTSTVAWLVAGAAAGLVPLLTRPFGPRVAAAALRVAQGAAVVGIALAFGPVGVIVAFIATMAIHGAANPIHQGLLHRAVADPGRRATVVSVNSLMASAGGMLGGVTLGSIADATSLTVGIITGAVVLAAAAPLYLVGGANASQEPSEPVGHV